MSDSKRQDLPAKDPGTHSRNGSVGRLPAGLWVVATPIGNLGDFSPRAQNALASAAAILCEDTRVTARLLAAVGIETEAKLLRLDAHADAGTISRLVRRLKEGDSLALVSDAGTPALSDPGSALVREAREAGVVVTPIPGASALATLISVAGFAETEFSFLGFFPRATGDREEALKNAAASPLARVAVWFESPQRIDSALADVARLHSNAEIIAAKELTKLHERIFAGLAPEASTQVSHEIAREGTLGEWVFAVRFPKLSAAEESDESSEWVKALHCLLDAGISASEAAKRVSHHFGVAKNSVYEKSLSLTGKKNSRGD